tara:strand:- start:532 stop:1002 length:471 start_codon:yes stop_codon:yes gene_type:complete
MQKAPVPIDWDRKLAQGEAFERRIIELFEGQGHQAWKPTDRKYDLRINIEVPYYGSLALTGECKFDAMATSTKRLALQVWDGGKPRGIHPKGPCPDLWIHGVGDEAWIVRTSFVRSMVETLNLRPIETGDVGMRARCVLVPIEQARKLVGGTWLTL